MSKFKVGDKVRVIKVDDTFNSNMKKRLNKIVTIANVRHIGTTTVYQIKEDKNPTKYLYKENCLRLVTQKRKSIFDVNIDLVYHYHENDNGSLEIKGNKFSLYYGICDIIRNIVEQKYMTKEQLKELITKYLEEGIDNDIQ